LFFKIEYKKVNNFKIYKKGAIKMHKRNCTVFLIMVLFIFLLIFPITSFSADINSIVQQMEKSYQQQIKGIKDMTIVQEMKTGFFNVEVTNYYKKAIVNNEEMFMSRAETSMMGIDTVTIFDGLYTWSNDPATGEVKQEERGIDSLQVWKMFKTDKARYLGDEAVDGKDAYKVQLDDIMWMMGMEDLVSSNAPEDSEIEMHGIYWIDKETLVPLKAKNFTKTTTVEDGETVIMDMITDIQFLDYRPVGSMLVSHRMLISNQMEVDDPSLTPEEKKEAQAFMSSMGGMGSMEMVVTRSEYNTGLSDELFDGTQLETQEPMFGDMTGNYQEVPDDYEEDAPMSQEEMEKMMEGVMDMMKEFMPKD
jgi:hypothetical protein